jgi:hypothetical protein
MKEKDMHLIHHNLKLDSNSRIKKLHQLKILLIINLGYKEQKNKNQEKIKVKFKEMKPENLKEKHL